MGFLEGGRKGYIVSPVRAADAIVVAYRIR